MLGDAKQRNDVLSQAYAALHAEYVALKASQQIGDPAAAYPQQQHPQYGLAAYGGGPGAAGLTGVEGLDMDLFVYGDLSAGYTL